jgi:outer membrane protein assembly factor BamB/plastocyanin
MQDHKLPSTKILFVLLALVVVVSLLATATITWAQSTSPSASVSPSPSASATPTGSTSPTALASPTASATAAATVPFTPVPSASATASPSPVSAIPPEVTQYSKDWPLPNRDYTQTRATTDSTINSSNVNTLGVAWKMDLTKLGSYGGATSNPIIIGNTVYFQDLQANVYALDLATGQTKWTKMYNSAGAIGPNGPSVGWGKVFAHKDLYTLAALDSNNGNELWSIKLSNVTTTGIDIQPVPYNGMVYTSTVPGAGDVFYRAGGRGILYAIDQATGQVKWNFDTVKSANLFGHPEVNSGGGAWYPPAIDTSSGQMFWSIANPAPFPGTTQYPNGSSFVGDTLYTDSLISIANDTGNLKWYNQVIPKDIQDHDLMISPILTTATVNGQQQNIVITAGKMGKVYAMNRDTGNLLWVAFVGEHNPAGELEAFPQGVTTTALPGVIGGVETPMAYANGVVYVPTIDIPSDWTPTQFDRSTFDVRRANGYLTAINVNTGMALWIKKFNYAALGGATVINDLVFTATFDGTIWALKRDSGQVAWSYKAPAGINAWPAVSGDTIIWPAGAANTIAINTFGTPQLIALKLGAAVPSASATPATSPVPSPSPSSAASPSPSISASPSASPPISASPSVSASPSATPVASASPSASVSPGATSSPTGTSSGGASTISLTAQNFAFNMSTITVKSGSQVTINFNNMDAGVPHNFAAYTNSAATTPIFVGQIINGVATTAYTFTAPSTPGTYFFRCDAHPTTMTGQFIVQ